LPKGLYAFNLIFDLLLKAAGERRLRPPQNTQFVVDRLAMAALESSTEIRPLRQLLQVPQMTVLVSFSLIFTG
jgi:hypothetical protein